MFDNQIAREIGQGLLNARATAHSLNEVPPLEIRDIAPYPALFRSEIQRLFGIRLMETDLGMTIDELASVINLNRAGLRSPASKMSGARTNSQRRHGLLAIEKMSIRGVH
jgi:hypothetical protein